MWHGQQITSSFCETAWRRNVFLYPMEYLSYGVGKQSNVVTRPDGAKEYRFFDHLGSSRGVLGSNGFTYSLIGLDSLKLNEIKHENHY
ncbi:MAG: hypothetical protein DYG96_13065 [Chlorobi bacterium CHB2]|nr:hypothetical protein [Chlorobi bacterium CHB2]